ncbi:MULTISPECIES: hypothetical protein [Aphanothece]|uniref:hypothetical protein n=1 Tax=Aphanothece TaxID=1121 RepID=UPI003984B392
MELDLIAQVSMQDSFAVYFDSDISALQRYGGGISRYFTNLTKALLGLEVSDITFVYPGLEQYRNISVPAFLSNADDICLNACVVKSFMDPILANVILKKPVVYHPTYYRNLALKYMSMPVVVTIHDMIHELMPLIRCTISESDSQVCVA